MRHALSSLLVAVAASAAAGAAARADDLPPAPEPVQMPYAVPRETLIPGTPGMPGGVHLMVNAFAMIENQGLGGYAITNPGVATGFDGGATRAQLQHDWLMGYAREEHGRVEGLLMLDLEPLTVGPEGMPELGQSGEGLWDAQHSHLLFHQAMVAVHPLAWAAWGATAMMMPEPLWDLSIFAGQGSATIGPPVFMHRASSPGPTVPRKHHKGENPHETSPVIGMAVRYDVTTVEASIFGAKELAPADSRFYPHPAAPTSFAARVRRIFADSVELQISGERLHAQADGEPDAWQASASAYFWRTIGGLRLDGLLDWALDRPDLGPSAQGALAELAVRSTDRRAIAWMRSEINQREEPAGAPIEVSSPWLFETAGAEYVAFGSRVSGLQLGVFAEATYTHIPDELAFTYGRRQAVAMNIGLHLFGMWMLDSGLRRMHHDH
jgi:hypothetical protein